MSFGASQDRIHQADSRVRKLPVETPGLLILFDCLATAMAESLIARPLSECRAELEWMMRGFGRAHRTRLSPITLAWSKAQRWLDDARGALDGGVVGKRINGGCEACERAMVKVKRVCSADCIVGGPIRQRDA